MITNTARFQQAIAKFDAANAQDPNQEIFEGNSYPKELLQLGIREYRQALFKPYRLIYRVTGKQVFIYMIADGRRDMQMLLTRRMLGV